MEQGLHINLHGGQIDTFDNNRNVTVFLSESTDGDVSASELDPDYEQFLADVWVGVVLTLMVLSCVCCMCSCLLYHKFQQWKRSVIDSRNSANLEAGAAEAELPSYTIASGLPTYQEALEQLKKVKELTKTNSEKGNGSTTTTTTTTAPSVTDWVPSTPPTPLSVMTLFQIYKKEDTDTNKQPN